MVDEKSNPNSFDAETFKTELMAEISREVSKITNAAITQRFTAFESKLEKQFVAPSINEDPTTEKPKYTKEKDSEFLALKNKMAAIEAEKASMVARERDANLRKNLTEQLTKAGIDPRFMRAAVATLIDADKVVGYTSDEYDANKDRVVFRNKSGEVDLVEGLRDWIKEDGKNYIAAKGVRGSGQGQVRAPGSAPVNQEDRARANLEIALQKMRRG